MPSRSAELREELHSRIVELSYLDLEQPPLYRSIKRRVIAVGLSLLAINAVLTPARSQPQLITGAYACDSNGTPIPNPSTGVVYELCIVRGGTIYKGPEAVQKLDNPTPQPAPAPK